jgi:hypothetical protein
MRLDPSVAISSPGSRDCIPYCPSESSPKCVSPYPRQCRPDGGVILYARTEGDSNLLLARIWSWASLHFDPTKHSVMRTANVSRPLLLRCHLCEFEFSVVGGVLKSEDADCPDSRVHSGVQSLASPCFLSRGDGWRKH